MSLPRSPAQPADGATAGDPTGPAGADGAWPPGCFRRYRRPAVRDLAWLVFDGALQLPQESGALASAALDPAERSELLALLQRWDEDEDDAWLGPVDPNLRLGLYAERLLGAWLGHARRIRLLAQNWPLRVGGITLGEADLLVERAGGSLELWELACKFYLGVPGKGWIGPGLNDSLAAKVARMRSHQLPLIERPGFLAAWAGEWSAKAWLTGWLLAPAQSPAPAPSRSARIPAVWAEQGAASLALAQASADSLGVRQWWLLPKRRWLRPVFGDEPVAQVFGDLAEAAAFLAGPGAPKQRATDHPRPMMLAGVGNANACAAEALRLMLVPRGWSQRAAALQPPAQQAPDATLRS